MTTKKLLEALRADVAELRKEVAELKAQRCQLRFAPSSPTEPIPSYPHYPVQPQPFRNPYYPPIGNPTTPTITW